MKKSIIIAAALLAVSMTASLLLSCVTPPIKSNAAGGEKFETTKAPETHLDTEIKGGKDEVKELTFEKDERGYSYCEFATSDPEWTFTYTAPEWILTHTEPELTLSNGDKTFVYGDYKGDNYTYAKCVNYGILFYPSRGTEAAKAIISPDDRYAVLIIDGPQYTIGDHMHQIAYLVELENGCILELFVPSWREILEANGYETSDLAPYMVENESIATAPPAFRIELSAEFADGSAVLTQRLITDDEKIDITYIAEPFYDIDPAFESLPCLAIEKDYMTAFVRGDSKKLEELLYCKEEGMFSVYETLKFSDYKATVSADGTVILTVDVTESGINAISPGRHVYTVSEGMLGVYMIDIGRSYSYNSTDKNPVKQFLRTWFNSIIYDFTIHNATYYAEKMGAYTASTYLYDFLGGYLTNYADPSIQITGNELKSAAEKIFGLTDHSGLDRVYYIDGDGFAIYNFGHGGSSYYYEFVEVTDTTATVRFYADHNYTIESDLVKYVFDVDEDTGWLIPVSAEILEKGEYAPGHHSV
ncbi:MAG: hypothetical protein IKV54_05540 [Clostridia bacterium]|nr:hypothetical protein [Clostridia bacterium]